MMPVIRKIPTHRILLVHSLRSIHSERNKIFMICRSDIADRLSSPFSARGERSDRSRPKTAQRDRAVSAQQHFAANDDGSTGAVPLNIGGTGGINFFGQTFTQVYVNNNGNLTFGDSFSDFTPNALAEGVMCDRGNTCPIIAPFFADVDTTGTGSGLVQYGNATVNGFNAFVANYINVGYFARKPTNSTASRSP